MSEAINKTDLIKGDPFGEIGKDIMESLSDLEKWDQKMKDIAKTLSVFSGTSKTTVQGINDINKAEIESEKLMKQKIITQQTTTKLLIEQEKLKQASIRTQKVENSIKEKTLTLYQQESRKLNDLRNAYKNLAVQNKENSKEAKALLAQIIPLDNKLKSIDKTVGQSQRNVGNYGSALDGLKGKFSSLIGVASQFGLALGGVALVQKSIKVLKEFDEGAADIAKTTGMSVEQTRKLSQELLKIDTKTAIGELQGLAAAAGSLNISGEENIIGFVEAADKAFVALGDDLGGTAQEIATNVGKIAGVFGDEKKFGIGPAINKIGSAINELAGKSKAAAAPILDFTQRMAGLGNLISSADTAALGAFFDEGGQSVEVASSTLNTLLPKMAQNYKAFAKTAGMSAEEFKKLAEESPIEALKAVAEGAKNSEKGLFNLSKTVESFGVDSARATSIVGFLANNTERLTELQKVSNDAFREGTSLTNEFNTKNQTLGANFDKVTNAISAYIIGADSATGATAGLSQALGYIAQNLPQILSVVGKLIKLWVTYKLVTGALKLRETAIEWNDNRKAIKDAGDALGGTTDKAKGFGDALKGIGLSVAIGLLIEIGMKFYDIASGAEAARNKMALFNDEMARGTKFGSKYSSDAKQQMDNELKLLDLRRASEKLSDSIYLNEKKRIIENSILKIQTMKTYALEDRKRKKEEMERQKRLYDYQMSLNPFIRDQAIISGYEVQRAAYLGLGKEINEYDKFLREAKGSLTDNTIAEIENANATSENSKEKKKAAKEVDNTSKQLEFLRVALRKTTDGYKELIDVQKLFLDPNDLERALALENERVVLGADIALIEAQITLEKAKQSGDTDAILKAEEAVLQAKIKQIEAQRDLDLSKTLNPNEQDKINKQAELDILGLTPETVKEKTEEVYNVIKQFQEAITQLLTDQIDKRIALLKKEEDAAKSQQDFLEQLAENGNITAKESIAEQIEIQREAQEEQMRLEKMKENIELISAGLGTFNSLLSSGKSPAEALAGTIASTQVLVGFLKNMQFFAKGTANAPEGLHVVDEKGPEIIADKHGNIKSFGQNKGARVQFLSKGDQVITATKTADLVNSFGQVQNAQQMGLVKDSAGTSYDLMNLKALMSIEKAVKSSKSDSKTDWGGIAAGIGEIVHRKYTKGNVITNRYRIKP